MEAKKSIHSVALQTASTIDIPYVVSEPLPPIFGSTLCRKTKPIFLSKSLPDLSHVSWVTITAEDTLLEGAEEALNEQYDREVAAFYSEARKEAAAVRYLKGLTEETLALDVG